MANANKFHKNIICNTFGVLVVGSLLSGIVSGGRRYQTENQQQRKRFLNAPIKRSLLFSESAEDEDRDREPLSNASESETGDFFKDNRRINLPSDYDRLHIPVMSRQEFNKKIAGKNYNESIAEYFYEKDNNDEDLVPNLDLKVDVIIRSIRDIDELNEQITVEMDFTTAWIDMLVCVENNCFDTYLEDPMFMAVTMQSIDPAILKRIWKPDLFIENLVSISRPDLMSPPIKVLFSPKGSIIYQSRVTVNLDCNMEFKYYPADSQHCVFKIRSYSHETVELDLEWNDEGEGNNGVFMKNRDENNFDVKIDGVDRYYIREAENKLFDGSGENYRVLEFTISLRRKMSYHLIQTYLPSIFFIIITWLCFLVPANMVEARIGVSMTTLLTLTSMFASVRESSPIVSYVKAIDIWMVACIFSVFLTLFEFTLLIWLQCEDEDKIDQSREKVDEIVNCKFFIGFLHKKRNKPQIAKWIERWAFLMFFILFTVFNVVYWTWLLRASKYFDWEVDPKYNGPDPDDE